MDNKNVKKIAVLTSGGDAPGMNAAVRAVVRSSLNNGLEVYGIRDGYYGLVNNDIFQMKRKDVTDILTRGGTILGTARLPEFAEKAVQEKGANNLKALGIDGLVVVGGDGSYRGALGLTDFGIKCIGIPGTIDNDIASTEYTIGFDTAVHTAVDAIDKLRDTCNSHQRCSIIEVMGRYCGDIAFAAGIACGADKIITSETGFDENELINYIKERKHTVHRHLLIVITEHITDTIALAKKVREETGWDSRATVLGHIQRGGSPSPFDRILATRLGEAAVESLLSGENSECLGVQNNEIIRTPFKECFDKKKNVFYKYAIDLNNQVR